jgi:hypothetical protein
MCSRKKALQFQRLIHRVILKYIMSNVCTSYTECHVNTITDITSKFIHHFKGSKIDTWFAFSIMYILSNHPVCVRLMTEGAIPFGQFVFLALQPIVVVFSQPNSGL